MGAPYPQFIPQAFAINAAGSDRNTIPSAPVTTQRASFSLGFPPLTMTPVIAGGKPMLGPDMNGILYMLSSHAVYAQGGRPYQFSTDVVTAISGYAVGTILSSTDGLGIWYNLVAGNTTDPNASGAGWVPLFSYGLTSIAGLVGGIRTLTLVEAAKGLIVLTGALLANQQIVLPNVYRDWLIVNGCTGAFTTTVKTVAGSGVVVPAGGYAAPVGVYCNTVDINPTVSPTVLPTDVSPTPSTIPLRDNLGFTYSATPAAGDNSTRDATTAYVQANMVGGVGQVWSNPARAANTSYTNATGRPIFVSVSVGLQSGGGSATLICDGITVGQVVASGANTQFQLTAIIPAGSTYRANTAGVVLGLGWAELR